MLTGDERIKSYDREIVDASKMIASQSDNIQCDFGQVVHTQGTII